MDQDLGYHTCLRYPSVPNNPAVGIVVADIQDILELAQKRLENKLDTDQPKDNFQLWCSLYEWYNDLNRELVPYINNEGID